MNSVSLDHHSPPLPGLLDDLLADRDDLAATVEPSAIIEATRQGRFSSVERLTLACQVQLAALARPALEPRAETFQRALRLHSSMRQAIQSQLVEAVAQLDPSDLPESSSSLRQWLEAPPAAVEEAMFDLIQSLELGEDSTARQQQQQQQQRLDRLVSPAYEHPADRLALSRVKAVPGLGGLVGRLADALPVRREMLNLLGNSIEVTSRCLPRLHAVFQECCEVLDVDPPPRLFVTSGSMGGYTIGATEPLVVLYSSSVDRLTSEELRVVIGHELGHVKAGHFPYHLVAKLAQSGGEWLANATLGASRPLHALLSAPLTTWKRASELTADRAGFLACQDRETALRAMMKVSGAPARHSGDIDVEAYLDQARRFEHEGQAAGVARLWTWNDQFLSDHPFMALRVMELEDWIVEGGAREIINGDPATRARLARRWTDDPELDDLVAVCTRVLTSWASREFATPRHVAGPLVRAMIHDQALLLGTPLEPILHAQLSVAETAVDRVSYQLRVITAETDHALDHVLIVPVDPHWDRVPAALRGAIIRGGGQPVSRLLYTSKP